MPTERNIVIESDGYAVQNVNATAVGPCLLAPVRANNDDGEDDVPADENDEHTLNQREKLLREYKKRFLLYVRVCIKYLEYKDPVLHRQVLLLVNDCSRRNRNNEPGYESITLSLRFRLFKILPDVYQSAIEEKVLSLERQQLLRDYKERFLLHVRVCIKFLEYKDPALHQQVLFTLNDCSRRNRNNEPGYEDLELSIRHKLFNILPDVYWSVIEDKVRRLEQQEEVQGQSRPAIFPVIRL